MRKQDVSVGFLVAALVLMGIGCSTQPQSRPGTPTQPSPAVRDPYEAPPSSGGSGGGIPTGEPVTGPEPDLFNPAQ